MRIENRNVLCMMSVLVFLSPFFFFQTGFAAEPKNYKVGANFPLTGHVAIYSTWTVNGAQCAADEFNEKGDIKIELIAEDNSADTAKGVSAFNKLARMDKTPCVLSAVSKIIMATAPIAERNNVAIFNVGAISPDLLKAGPSVVHVIPLITYEIKALARYTKEKLPQVKTVATFVTNDVFGLGARDALISEFQAQGIKYVGGEFIELSAPSYKTQLAKLKALNPDAIYTATYGKEDMILAFKQAKELGINTQWMGYQTMAAPGIWEGSNGGNEGAVFTQAPFDSASDNPVTQAFVSRYKKKYGQVPELYAAIGYDAVLLFKRAVELINKNNMALNGQNIRKALLEIRKFETSTGTLIFEDNGTCIKPVAIRKVVQGKFENIVIVPPK